MDLDKVMIALEEASQSVPAKQDGWATIAQVKSFAKPPAIANQLSLEALVSEGRAERKYPVSYMNRLYRPSRGGGFGGSGDTGSILDTREGIDGGPRGSQDEGPRGGQEVFTFGAPVGGPAVPPTVVGGTIRNVM